MDALVQYVAVRSDLLKALKWPIGAVITQACHGCSAALHVYRSDPNTIAYLADVDRMHKVVVDVSTVGVARLSVLLRELFIALFYSSPFTNSLIYSVIVPISRMSD